MLFKNIIVINTDFELNRYLIPIIKYIQSIISLPFQLITIIIIALLFGNFIPEVLKAFCLSISLSIKNILIFILPFIIFSFSFFGFSRLKNGLLTYTILLLSLICISNFIAVIISYYVSIISCNTIVSNITPTITTTLNPVFELVLPNLCSNTIGLITGILVGIFTSITQIQRLSKLSEYLNKASNNFLNKIFIPILPIFILGFLLKFEHTGNLNIIFKNFIPLLILLVVLYCSYISLAYFIVMNFNFKNAISAIINIIPAAITGFSTMSSVASLPVLTTGVIKNSKDETITRTVLPSIINTHMLGDALAIPLMALSLYSIQYHNVPEFSVYLKFAISYVFAKFAAAGIPGGTIIIMIPILEANLHFTPEMSGIILIIYMLFDPFCTMSNIFGNGLFPIIFEKIWKKLKNN